MAFNRWFGAAFAVTLVACTQAPKSISGTYVLRNPHEVELLQITQSPDGQLLGSLDDFAAKPDGTTQQGTANVSGTTDGKSLTLVLRVPVPLAQPLNISGAVDGDVIVLNMANNSARFVPATAEDYQAAIRDIRAQAGEVQKRNAQALQNLAGNKQAFDLTTALNAYATKIQNNPNWLPSMHDTHAKILSEARNTLSQEKKLQATNSVQAIQAQVHVQQLGIQLSQYNMQLDQDMQNGRRHIQQFDTAIAESPCTMEQAQLDACREERAAAQRYQSVREKVLQEIAEADSASKRSSAEMQAINKDAGN